MGRREEVVLFSVALLVSEGVLWSCAGSAGCFRVSLARVQSVVVGKFVRVWSSVVILGFAALGVSGRVSAVDPAL